MYVLGVAAHALASTRCTVSPTTPGVARNLGEEALLFQLGDFGALKAEAGHQALLVEDECVDIVL